jgi:hypothetical protein
MATAFSSDYPHAAFVDLGSRGFENQVVENAPVGDMIPPVVGGRALLPEFRFPRFTQPTDGT